MQHMISLTHLSHTFSITDVDITKLEDLTYQVPAYNRENAVRSQNNSSEERV
jgi:hypothetical protein